ncbi:protein DpdH [Geodermatophilus sp. FMUSA9-8]|uniref:protein DpdH n=1 Tax=Geodermatophilus sp. FMUSA9-8 TaxID=3120155 RepID=UPI00300A036E
MSDFNGYVCWDKSTVTATIATEAVSPSKSVFLATHAPLDIHRTSVAGGRPGVTKVVSERDVLNDFLTRPTNNGVLIMPVLGESGAGKSHLVRWIAVQLESTSKREVIYLPKDNTSLSGVIELLLADNHGSPFDEIRADMARIGREVSQEALERGLLDQLAEALLEANPETPQERALLGKQGLYALLHDPFFREKLLRPGSLIPRRAAHAINGRETQDGDVPLQFTVDDLPLDLADIDEAALVTRRLYGRLASDGQLQVVAASLLQRHLDVAVMQATSLGVGRVYEAFLAIRRALAGNKEIILLVEDFALVQGVQRDLLDAITETGEREGVQVLAPVRTLMAVTTGYFGDLPATVRTRVDSCSPYRYELRVILGDGGTRDTGTEDRVVDMIGRYLNAARIGRTRLETLGVEDEANTPNACMACPVQETCHAGFGSSSAGHGLYPYNKPALLRAVRATALPEQPNLFNPRGALARVVRAVLQDHEDDVRAGRFPNAQFETKFPPSRAETVLPASVRAQITTLDPGSGARRQVLLQYWGDAPSHVTNVAPEIHVAFQIPELSDDVIEAPPTARPPTVAPIRGTHESPRNQLSPSVQRKLAQIEHWLSRDENFPTDLANDIRQTVRQAVLSRASWTDPVMKEPSTAILDKAWPRSARTVSIEGAAEAIARNVQPPIRFGRTPENAVFFADLVKLRAGVVEGTLQTRLRLDRLAELHAPTARRAVVSVLQSGDADLVSALRVSIGGASLAGVVVPGASDQSLLDAALVDLTGFVRTDDATRSPLWKRALERHLSARNALVRALREATGVSQGVSGDVHAVDARRLLPLVRKASTEWRVSTDDEMPEWVRPAYTPLLTVADAVAEELGRLAELVAAIRLRLPVGTSLSQTSKAVLAAIDAGEGHGFVRHSNLPLLRARNQAAEGLTTRALEVLESDLASLASSSFETRLRVAAVDRGDSLPRLLAYLQENEVWLDAGLAMPTGDESSEASELLRRLGAVVTDWSGLVSGRESDS